MDDVEQWVRDRREVLVREREIGETRLRELEREVAVLQRSLVEVGGAVRVLDELLTRIDAPEPASGDALRVG
ncbi:hypothetical protein [Pseudonocardia endophytica]|uniref:Uncharacterized protein n=1 Tax=Pseudonocardia endophytica TaxID=401976 RepID=A0A4R1HQ86_PSEEN|nr:hypothetical protein [Pseudonocardia endophytica]TCK22865.1 hypothetical protein EV378_6876 [Pseudonocardia endophytica]